ncbi:hypothetical protein EG329_011532 [Mollisiaceae sp. DMI_Dod_QoI]|nr:hypothetical protein EG329_011532 [Helotiales sp. DMI_Dod_QoI]
MSQDAPPAVEISRTGKESNFKAETSEWIDKSEVPPEFQPHLSRAQTPLSSSSSASEITKRPSRYIAKLHAKSQPS